MGSAWARFTNCSTQSPARAKKFLIFFWPTQGFGAALVSAVAALHFAERSGRVMVIQADWNQGFFSGLHNSSDCPNKAAVNPWECYFMPPSSCTVADALEAVHVKSIADLLAEEKKYGQWVNGNKISRLRSPRVVRTVFVNAYMPWMSTEAREVRGMSKSWNQLQPQGHDDLYFGLAMQYVIRLNEEFKNELRPMLKKIIPQRLDHRGDRAVGLPVRGSDKCGKPVNAGDETSRGSSRFEAACLPFHTYMEAVNRLKEIDTEIDTVVVTSEDQTYIDAAMIFRKTKSAEAGLSFVFNTLDEHQGDSRMQALANSGLFSHHIIMISMWTTLELQMRAKYYLINCNSHWHVWIVAMRRALCGSSTPVVFCLDEQRSHSPYFMCTQENMKGKGNLAKCRSNSKISQRRLY
mmetsp:Transcript_13465/g.25730  ORF Transcript_13465/g.25730 Transcript_13465/m.25730 type:complete len:407 (+) Transcript_13465:61-1281(+)